jgi:CRP/FNR family transcriptional regulator, cyclic AMP receptor protein
MTKSILDLIREHPFLSDLTESQYETIAGCAKNMMFKPGAYIIREGQRADQFHLIREGNVALEVYAPRGGSRVLQTLGPNDILGASWIVPPYRWTSDARALDRVHVFAFDAKCLREKCDADTVLGYALMKRFVPILVDRMSAARLQALDLYGAGGDL